MYMKLRIPSQNPKTFIAEKLKTFLMLESSRKQTTEKKTIKLHCLINRK